MTFGLGRELREVLNIMQLGGSSLANKGLQMPAELIPDNHHSIEAARLAQINQVCQSLNRGRVALQDGLDATADTTTMIKTIQRGGECVGQRVR